MTDLITPQDLNAEMLRLSRELDVAHAELIEAGRASAEADHCYRLTKAKAFLRAAGKTVADRERKPTCSVARRCWPAILRGLVRTRRRSGSGISANPCRACSLSRPRFAANSS